ncbi:MAG: UDP-N-acetylmuramoyl-L-alanine--D-glutamate ligase [Acidobacteria bacterium]|nr:MAG: UDP-N-acetylmuramoyl-L-alanine--D-glutamate ligase [Acidobacteriota bacterium]
MDIRGKNVLVVGLARSGVVAARWLSEHGAAVTGTDTRGPEAFQKVIPDLFNWKIGLELGLHRESTFLRQDLIVVSPGVPADLPILNLARQKGIPVVPEIEVAGWFLKGRLAGITGTNGKTTTTTLLGRIMEASGYATFVGGNIGVPLLSAVDLDPPASVIVAELSSFQLETISSFRPHVAALLNLSPNHLDRHPNFEAYIAAKARIFSNQTEDDYAILNADDENVMKLVPSIRSQKVFFSRRRELPNGTFVSGGMVLYRVQNLEVALMRTSDVRLLGDFNLENVLAASAAACVLGAEFSSIRRAVRDFSGVEHRLEFVREIRGVEFYNDSKATSVDAAAKALSTFERGVHLILGGKDKGAPYAPLRSLLKDRVREVLVIGAAQKRIANDLAGAVEIVEAGDLETAVMTAAERARPGDVVLLAPACSSFDQFQDFEHRGRVFKDLVERLAEKSSMKGNDRVAHQESAFPGPATRMAGEAAMLPAAPSVTDGPKKPAAGQEASCIQKDSVPIEPEPLVLAAPRELAYVFEVSAEEASMPGYRDFEGAADEFVLDEDDLTPPETVKDEAFAYEVRAATSMDTGSADAQKETSPKTNYRKRSHARKVK